MCVRCCFSKIEKAMPRHSNVSLLIVVGHFIAYTLEELHTMFKFIAGIRILALSVCISLLGLGGRGAQVQHADSLGTVDPSAKFFVVIGMHEFPNSTVFTHSSVAMKEGCLRFVPTISPAGEGLQSFHVSTKFEYGTIHFQTPSQQTEYVSKEITVSSTFFWWNVLLVVMGAIFTVIFQYAFAYCGYQLWSSASHPSIGYGV